jgi:signal transduction histidine kinase
MASDHYLPINSMSEIKLTYNEDVFSFEFVALDYTNAKKNHYAYKMERFEKDWNFCGTRRYASYTHLDPGEYVFMVRGSNNDNVWNNIGSAIKITISPPYWKTWWFRSILAILFLSAGPVVYYRRVSKLKKERLAQQEFSRKLIDSQEAERKRLAAELHDGLGQDLLIVKNELQQYARQSPAPGDHLERVSSMIGESIEGVREIAANLHPHHLDRLGLRVALEVMVEKVSRSSGVAFQSEIEDIDSIFPNETQMNLYRIVQEALSNIVRHSGATSAQLVIKKLGREVQVMISDDGKGLDSSDESQTLGKRFGFGIANMTERVKLIKGTMAFGSQSGKGVTVSITIPLPGVQ